MTQFKAISRPPAPKIKLECDEASVSAGQIALKAGGGRHQEFDCKLNAQATVIREKIGATSDVHVARKVGEFIRGSKIRLKCDDSDANRALKKHAKRPVSSRHTGFFLRAEGNVEAVVIESFKVYGR